MADLSACLWPDPVSACLHAEHSAQASTFVLLSPIILTLISQEPGRAEEQLHTAWTSQGGAWPGLSQDKPQDGNSSRHTYIHTHTLTILMPFADLGCLMSCVRGCVRVSVCVYTLTIPVVG